jgi:hypothetical protein
MPGIKLCRYLNLGFLTRKHVCDIVGLSKFKMSYVNCQDI